MQAAAAVSWSSWLLPQLEACHRKPKTASKVCTGSMACLLHFLQNLRYSTKIKVEMACNHPCSHFFFLLILFSSLTALLWVLLLCPHCVLCLNTLSLLFGSSLSVDCSFLLLCNSCTIYRFHCVPNKNSHFLLHAECDHFWHHVVLSKAGWGSQQYLPYEYAATSEYQEPRVRPGTKFTPQLFLLDA